MANLIALVVLLLSFAGLVYFLLKKMPALAKIQASSNIDPGDLATEAKKKLKEALNPIDLDYELYLQKILSKIRILTLKTESKTAGWLETLRQRSKKSREESKDYWEELKKAKEGREK